MKFAGRARKRPGISELTAAVLTIAITLIAGFALYGYVNGEAAVNENAYGQAVGKTVNVIRESFVVVDLTFPGPSCPAGPPNTCINILIYNNGQTNLQIPQIIIFDSTKTQMYVIVTDAPSGTSCVGGKVTSSPPIGTTGVVIPPQSTQQLDISISSLSSCLFKLSTTYYANILGSYGNSVFYNSCDGATCLAPSLSLNPTSVSHTSLPQPITLSGTGYAISTTYQDCLGTSSSSTGSCVAGSTSGFTSSSSGNIPASTTVTVPAGTSAGTYYVLVYLGSSNIVSMATLVVT